jgi:hypothetical protein
LYIRRGDNKKRVCKERRNSMIEGAFREKGIEKDVELREIVH